MIRSGFFGADEIQRAINAVALLHQFHRNVGLEPTASVPETQTKPEVPSIPKGKRVSELMEKAIQENTLAGMWTGKTTADTRSIFDLFIEVIGDLAIDRIDHQVMLRFRDTLAKLPANRKKNPKYRDLTVKQVLALPNLKPMSITRVNKILGRLGAFFSWCRKHGFVTVNVASGLAFPTKVRADSEREAYSIEDIAKMLRSPIFSSFEAMEHPERFWLPLLGMYTGARLNELAQLYVEDVREIGGILCIDINDAKDKTVKSMSGKRIVPIHQTLLDIGFAQYVETMRGRGHPRLFMDLPSRRDGYGHAFSAWFQTFNRRFITDNPKRVFHSLRHGVADQLKQKGCSEIVIAEILGHSVSSITMRRYGKSYQPRVLLETLRLLEYPVNITLLQNVAKVLSDVVEKGVVQ